MINYLIVDDEPQARKLLQAYLSEMSDYRLIKLCSNAIEAYEVLQTTPIDVMFLDIKMPLIAGNDFLRSLKNPPLVIFTTAFNKYAIESYELSVIDYLLKPIALPRLISALDKVKERLEATSKINTRKEISCLFVKAESKLVKIDFEDILLIEGMQNYVKLHLLDKTIIASYTMKALLTILPVKQFLRVHRSFIIPVKSIVAITGNTIETIHQQVPIGINFKAKVMEYISLNNN